MEKIYIFDVDETLYPLTSLSSKMRLDDHTKMVQKALKIDSYEDAQKKCTDLYQQHGTTFAGLAIETGMSFDEFHAFSHEWDYSQIHDEDKELESLIKQLNGKKYIYSAGNRQHIMQTLKALGICESIFDGIFASDDGDIMKPKPQIETKQAFIEKFNINPEKVIYFDDSKSCIDAGINLGWKECVLITHGRKFASSYKQVETLHDYLRAIV